MKRPALPMALALTVASALAAFGVVRGTRAVGGSDSSCYALMAEAFGTGHWQPSSALAVDAPWPEASRTMAPGGFIPSPVRPDAASPICAPGFSVLMAPFFAIGGREAIFLVTPVAAFALVWCAFVLANRLAGGLAGVSAAVLTAASPIVLFQVVPPMNDIATAAQWLAALALVCRGGSSGPAVSPDPRAGVRAVIAGILIGLAILVRPNLAPLAVLITALQWQLLGGGGSSTPAHSATADKSGPPEHSRPRSTALLVAGVVPGVAAWLWLNHTLYDSVVGSGYGDVGRLFSASHVAANLSNYGRALYQTQTVFPFLALAAPFLLTGEARRASLWLLGFAGVVVAIYLLYLPFPEWWYLRFLILAIVLMVVVACSVAALVADRTRTRGVMAIGTVVLSLIGMRTAGDRLVLQLQTLEGRYRDSAAVVTDRLPANAILITAWQSGSMRFHAGREVVVWDAMDPAWLDRAVAWLAEHGRTPYILVERREEPEFRDRFRGHAESGGLDWPPRFNVAGQARIFDPSDRPRYLAGAAYATENIRPGR